jgi:hypothetical protein
LAEDESVISELIYKAIEKKKSFMQRPADAPTFPATSLDRGLPTLRAGMYRDFRPLLKQRFELFGRWERATHGHWLGINDMEALWQESIGEDLLNRIKAQRIAGEQGWPNEASALFKPERLSLFACSDLTNETIYLLSLDFTDEPELWVYDSNGESRYKDLEEYLVAYLDDDISASSRSWRA